MCSTVSETGRTIKKLRLAPQGYRGPWGASIRVCSSQVKWGALEASGLGPAAGSPHHIGERRQCKTTNHAAMVKSGSGEGLDASMSTWSRSSASRAVARGNTRHWILGSHPSFRSKWVEDGIQSKSRSGEPGILISALSPPASSSPSKPTLGWGRQKWDIWSKYVCVVWGGEKQMNPK